MIFYKKLSVMITILIMLSVVSIIGFTDSYPEKTVETIVVWAAGGSTDAMVRIVAAELEEMLGKKFMVVNKPGASGELGWTLIANSKPDGYTIGNVNCPQLQATYIQREECKYRLDDFTGLANIITDPGVLAVRIDSPFKTVEDFIKYAKENPGVITVSHSGIGGDDYFALRALQTAAGIKLTGVCFGGSGESRAALLGGHISACLINESEALPMVKANKERVLAIMTKERSSNIPEVPTFMEKGYNVVSGSSRGLIAPAGMPEETKNILDEALEKIVNSPRFINKMNELTMPIDFIAGEEYAVFLKEIEDIVRKAWEEDPWIE